MQDKNIDEIFRTKLEAFEMEPSAGVWPRIAVDLNSAERNKSRIPYLGIAASMIVLLTAGIYFITQRTKKSPRQHLTNAIAKTVVNPSTHKNESILNSQFNSTVPKQSRIVLHQRRKVNPIPEGKISREIETRDTNKYQAVMTSIPQREYERIEALVPDATTQLAITQPVTETAGFISTPSLAAARLPYAGTKNTDPAKPRHPIHSLGGLINAVVARVDKRRDKIIEFTDDDDETNVTGVNLGIIKIKKEK